MNIASLEYIVLTQRTHPPVGETTRALTVRLHPHPVYKFGQSCYAIAEGRFHKEEGTKACYSGKAASHRGSVPTAYPEFVDSEI